MIPSDMAAQMRAIAADLEDYLQHSTTGWEDADTLNAATESLLRMANELSADE